MSIFDSLMQWNKWKLLEIEEAINKRLHCVKCDIFEIGRLLSEAKKVIGHGNFKKWIEETWGEELPYSTAACYKKIYEEYGFRPDLIKSLPVSFLIHMAHSKFPDKAKNKIVENPKAFKEADLNGTADFFKDFKQGQATEDQFVNHIEEQIQIGAQKLSENHSNRQARRKKRSRIQIFKDKAKGAIQRHKEIKKHFLAVEPVEYSQINLERNMLIESADELLELLNQEETKTEGQAEAV